MPPTTYPLRIRIVGIQPRDCLAGATVRMFLTSPWRRRKSSIFGKSQVLQRLDREPVSTDRRRLPVPATIDPAFEISRRARRGADRQIAAGAGGRLRRRGGGISWLRFTEL